MDKKSIVIGSLFFAAGMGLFFYNGIQGQKQAAQRAANPPAPVVQSAPAPAATAAIEAVNSSLPAGLVEEGTAADPEAYHILENDALRVELTSRGGGVAHVGLKDYHATQDSGTPVQLLDGAKVPALALSRETGGAGSALVPFAPSYRVAERTENSLVLEADLSNGLKVRRTYTLGQGEKGAAYTIRHVTTFTNPTPTAVAVGNLYFNVGTASPTAADPYGYSLNVSYLRDGKFEIIPSSQFKGGGLIFKSEPKTRIDAQGPITWAAVKNQFFTTLVTPQTPGTALVALPARFAADAAGNVPLGVSAELQTTGFNLEPGASQEIVIDYYTGPKSFANLSALGKAQEDIMQLGWFLFFNNLGFIAFVGKVLLSMMGWIHGLVGNWGVTIILATIVIRLVLWPLTAKAARASKRMQKLQAPIQELREKYKDNPQRLNTEMLELWKKHKINPLAGCWPMLVQFPIFIAFFNMLRSNAELRFAHFLWIDDLSMPDATIPLGTTIPFVGTHLNVLPFIWLVSMIVQMRMMPTPSVDNAQMKIMKWMPVIFFPFTYVFASGLVIYWTATNCFSIMQQSITNRQKDEEDAVIEAELAEKGAPKAALPVGPLLSKKKKK